MSVFLFESGFLDEIATVPAEASSFPDAKCHRCALGSTRQLLLFFASPLLFTTGITLATAEPLHSDAGRKNADGNHRHHFAPTECAAYLDCSGEELWIEQCRMSAGRQGELGLFDRPPA